MAVMERILQCQCSPWEWGSASIPQRTGQTVRPCAKVKKAVGCKSAFASQNSVLYTIPTEDSGAGENKPHERKSLDGDDTCQKRE